MAAAEICQVTPQMDALLASIEEIARAAALPPEISGQARAAASQRGFLVSDYDLERYRRAAELGQLIAVIADGQAVSFLLGYPPDSPVDTDDAGSLVIRRRYGAGAAIIKQIATRPGHHGHGYARALYRWFADQVGADIYAAIVKSPPNRGSEAFHRSLGFEEHGAFEHPDGQPRGVWRWPRATQANLVS